jgi:hypothetical protein
MFAGLATLRPDDVGPFRSSQRAWPERSNEAIGVAHLKAQSPSLAITLWRDFDERRWAEG